VLALVFVIVLSSVVVGDRVVRVFFKSVIGRYILEVLYPYKGKSVIFIIIILESTISTRVFGLSQGQD
jgi:hypothetical protein